MVQNQIRSLFLLFAGEGNCLTRYSLFWTKRFWKCSRL